MSQPTRAEIHTDVVLTAMAVKYMQKATNFVAGQVFPIVPVTKSSDKYRIYPKGDWFRDEAKDVPAGTPTPRSGYTMSSDTYSCDFQGIAKDIPDRIRPDADPDVNLDKGAVAFVTQRLMLRREVQWVADFFTSGKWATDASLSTLWSDYSTSTPIEDIEDGKEAILTSTGYEANKLVVGYAVWKKLKNHPQILERLGLGAASANPVLVTREMVARALELEAVFVAKAVKNTAAEGATPAMAMVHGKSALLCFAGSSPSTEEPTAGATFAMNAGTNTEGVAGLMMDRLRDVLAKSDVIEGMLAWDNKVTASDCGYFIPTAVS